MNPMTFVLVMCILLTIGCVATLTDNFKARWVSENQRITYWLFTVGLTIWGWLIYF